MVGLRHLLEWQITHEAKDVRRGPADGDDRLFLEPERFPR